MRLVIMCNRPIVADDYGSFLDTKMIIGVVSGTTGESPAWQRAAEAGLPRTDFRQHEAENELLLALKRGEIDTTARGEVGNCYQQGLDAELVTIDFRDSGEGFVMSLDPAKTDSLKQIAEALANIQRSETIGFLQWTADHGGFPSCRGCKWATSSWWTSSAPARV